MKSLVGVEIYFRSVLTLTLDKGEWSDSRWDRCLPWEIYIYKSSEMQNLEPTGIESFIKLRKNSMSDFRS